LLDQENFVEINALSGQARSSVTAPLLRAITIDLDIFLFGLSSGITLDMR